MEAQNNPFFKSSPNFVLKVSALKGTADGPSESYLRHTECGHFPRFCCLGLGDVLVKAQLAGVPRLHQIVTLKSGSAPWLVSFRESHEHEMKAPNSTRTV